MHRTHARNFWVAHEGLFIVCWISHCVIHWTLKPHLLQLNISIVQYLLFILQNGLVFFPYLFHVDEKYLLNCNERQHQNSWYKIPLHASLDGLLWSVQSRNCLEVSPSVSANVNLQIAIFNLLGKNTKYIYSKTTKKDWKLNVNGGIFTHSLME